ncbi:hypothetical protein [Nonomuraea cavernae]|uniref:Thioredoxin domain-containing protein n=1 Tax=Nonomuraea cavernae TaxID=2045107 RepID=A0A918DIB7_9ACTN|nr:hypothetical protein [Nonomuraea cavernae]MCA2185508.1 hypothetical protein [Nonomuraea cavernae]GGO66683.1 hypothetical protein GCM10012289_21290 [Nonomuraea cavernae]
MGYTGVTLAGLVWLLLLSFGLLVVRRELSILQDRVAVSGAAPADGLAIGALAPRFPGLRADDVVLFFFGDCAPCHELATEVARSADPGRYACVVSDGAMPGSAAGVRALLPADARALVGEEAAAVRQRYKVHSGPFGVAVSDGLVVSKGVLRYAEDLEQLRRAGYGAAASTTTP